MSDKLLTERHLEFLSIKEAAQARLSVHLSKYHIVGNHMLRLISINLHVYAKYIRAHSRDCITCSYRTGDQRRLSHSLVRAFAAHTQKGLKQIQVLAKI